MLPVLHTKACARSEGLRAYQVHTRAVTMPLVSGFGLAGAHLGASE